MICTSCAFVYSATHESRGISLLSVKYHMYLSKYTQIVKDEERESTENRHTEREQEITLREAEQKENRESIVWLASVLPRGILMFSVLFLRVVSGNQRDVTANRAVSLLTFFFCLSEMDKEFACLAGSLKPLG